MIVGGVVVETGVDKVVDGVKAQGKVAKRPGTDGIGSAFGRGQGVWVGR
jgi:AP-3 complex subunit sigma